MPKSSQPNILFLLSDEHSPHAIGCEGNPFEDGSNLRKVRSAIEI